MRSCQETTLTGCHLEVHLPTDYFALLDEPRRASMDADALKQKFLELTAAAHPDRAHGLGPIERDTAQRRYVELNAAYQCLREPRSRLRHLVELERGMVPGEVQPVPEDLMDLFLEVARRCRAADALTAERLARSSPVLKVALFERSQDMIEGLLDFQRTISERREVLVGSLARLDGEWTASTSGSPERARLLDRLESLYGLISYFDRWLAQLQERKTRLSL